MDIGNSSVAIGTIARGPAFRIFGDDDYWASSWLVNDDSGTGARPAFIDAMNGQFLLLSALMYLLHTIVTPPAALWDLIGRCVATAW